MSLCERCSHRMRQMELVGMSTVRWTGRYLCDMIYQSKDWKVRMDDSGRSIYEDPVAKDSCADFIPRKKGQTSLEAFL